jgi:hypothetical protein
MKEKMTKEFEQFVAQVIYTRNLQKTYFKTRDKAILTEAFAAEKKLDQMAEELWNQI